MKFCLFLVFFALEEVLAASQASNLLPTVPGSNVAAASRGMSLVAIGETTYEDMTPSGSHLVTRSRATSSRHILERQIPNPPTISAEEASTKKVPGGSKPGVFYRGDSRPPAEIFKSGFVPQGTDRSLHHHLSFAGGSGLVSLSRSRKSAEGYAFGRSAENNQKGYIYVIASKDVPNGYWVPEIYSPIKNSAVGANQEFAVDGTVPPSSISYAYQVGRDKPSSRSNKIQNDGYSLKATSPCSGKKRAICDATNFSAKASTYRARRVRLTKAVGKAAAITLLAPHARRLLEAVKQWDHHLGAAVRWLDGKIASLQELIGGAPRDDIDGNDLKAGIICAFKGGQAKEIIAGRPNNICRPASERYQDSLRRGFEAGRLDSMIEMCKGVGVYRGGDPAAWRWTQGYCEALHRTNEYAQRMWELALGGLVDSCAELEDDAPENEDLQAKLEQHCTALEAEVDKVQNPAAKPTLQVVGGTVTVGNCKCDAKKLPLFVLVCGRICRATLIQQRQQKPASTVQPPAKPAANPTSKPPADPAKPLREFIIGNCKCDTQKLPKYSFICGRICRASAITQQKPGSTTEPAAKPAAKPEPAAEPAIKLTAEFCRWLSSSFPTLPQDMYGFWRILDRYKL